VSKKTEPEIIASVHYSITKLSLHQHYLETLNNHPSQLAHLKLSMTSM